MAINKQDKNIEAQQASGDLQSQDLAKQSTSTQQAAPSGGVSLSSTSSLGGATAQAPKTDSSKMTSAGKRFANLKKFRTQNQDSGELANKVVGGLKAEGKNVSKDIDAANKLLTSDTAAEDKNITAGNLMGSDKVVETSDKFINNAEKDSEGKLVKKTDEKYSFGDNTNNQSSFVDASNYTAGQDGDFDKLDYDIGGGLNKSIKAQEQHRKNLRTSEGRYGELLNRFGSGRREYNRGTSLMDNTILNSGAGKNVIDAAASNESGLGVEQRGLHTADSKLALTDSERLRTGYGNVADKLTGQLNNATASAASLADAKYKSADESNKSIAAAQLAFKEGKLTKDQATELGLTFNADGTVNDFGADSSLIDNNTLGTDTSNVTSLQDKLQISGLSGLGGNLNPAQLEQYGATRTETGEFQDSEGNIIKDDVQGGLANSKFKDSVASNKVEYEGLQKNLSDYKSSKTDINDYPGLNSIKLKNKFGEGWENLSKEEMAGKMKNKVVEYDNEINMLNDLRAKNNAHNRKKMPWEESKDNSDLEMKIRSLNLLKSELAPAITNYDNTNKELTGAVTGKESNFYKPVV